MSDSLRTERPRALDAAPDGDRDAKIEQLLLLGLDRYFAAQYDHAINVWTRALFLDRSHARARAYIERARSALAERQRESEELLHNGIAAFERGEGGEARQLLQAAIDSGAPIDEALAVLGRLNRVEATARPEPPARSRDDRRPSPLRAATGRWPWGMPVLASLLALTILASGVYALAVRDRFLWRSYLGLQDAGAAAVSPIARSSVLLLPRRGETALTRARVLASGGHLHDALVALDRVRVTDPQRAEADRLRADIQRQLLALIHMPGRGSAERERGDRHAP